MIVLKVFTLLALVFIALLFAYFNLSPVKVSLLGKEYSLPLFGVVLVSFVAGFLSSYVILGIKLLGWKLYGMRLRNGLIHMWTGYPDRASREFSKLLNREEVIPLYIESAKLLGRKTAFYMQKYSLGIVESYSARELIATDLDRAKELLEKALGKNWKNLYARRLLVGVYFLKGEGEKAMSLQRELVADTEKSLREKQLGALASLIAEVKREDARDELASLPITPCSASVLLTTGEKKKVERYFSELLNRNMHNETLVLLIERGQLTPEVIHVVEKHRDKLKPLALLLLYMEVGMYEKLEGVKDALPEKLRRILSSERECGRELISYLQLFECTWCGKEYNKYSPLCPNCFEWNSLKLKEEDSYAD